MKHLILGSAGQIGYHLCNVLRARGEEVITYDIVDNPMKEDLRYQTSYLYSCIQKADVVYFLAFDIGGSVYMQKYQDTFNFIDNNSKIMTNVFNALEIFNKPFIFASSQMSNMSYSTYGILKALGEKYTEALGGVVVKFWNVYGYEKDEEKSHVITDFIKMALNNKEIKMRTNGKEVRQFLYGDDCAECLIELISNYEQIDRKKPLHITNFKWNSVLEIAEIIREFIPCTIMPSTKTDTVQLDKRNEPNDYILDFWKPTTPLHEGIQEIILKLNK